MSRTNQEGASEEGAERHGESPEKRDVRVKAIRNNLVCDRRG